MRLALGDRTYLTSLRLKSVPAPEGEDPLLRYVRDRYETQILCSLTEPEFLEWDAIVNHGQHFDIGRALRESL